MPGLGFYQIGHDMTRLKNRYDTAQNTVSIEINGNGRASMVNLTPLVRDTGRTRLLCPDTPHTCFE